MNIKEYQVTRYVAPTVKKKLKDLFWVLLFPVLAIGFCEISVHTSGLPLFTDQLNITNLCISMLSILIACFALNTNLNSGRMDFSLGAVGILGCITAWLILPNKADPNFPIWFLLLSLVFGALYGTVSGLVFVLLKIPAIVVSLGMCLIFEGLARMLADGKGSIDYDPLECPGLYPFISSPAFLITVLVIVCVFMLLTLKYSKFGHDKLSILYGQKVAVDTGVNEIKNAMICYSLAGALIALYTYINSIFLGKINISINLGSAMSVMANFLPIFLGGLIAKHSNEVVGLALGVISVSFFKEGLHRVGADSTAISLTTSFLIFAILTYMVNWTNWVRIVKDKLKNYKLSKYERQNN